MSARACYISSGCNCTPNVADWGRNGQLCYGSCHSVAVYRPEACGFADNSATVLCTLNSHKNRVNCVKWIRNGVDLETMLVSGSVDRTAVVWEKTGRKFQPIQTLHGHTGSVTAVEGMTVPSFEENKLGSMLVVTASSDSTVKIWSRTGAEEFVDLQSISFGTGFALDVALVLLPGTHVVLLAVAADDQKVHLFASKSDQFVPAVQLPGHEDWIRGAEFCVDDSGDVLLASCAQDSLVRIWRISRRGAACNSSSVKDLPLHQDIRVKETTFSVHCQDEDTVFAITLDSVLSGHEGWIYSVHWHPAIIEGNRKHQPLLLLTASMDKTMILWKPDADSGMWVEHVRVGEVGGNTLGFYGGLFSPDGNSILAHGYQGALHQWCYDEKVGAWLPAVTGGGHFKGVEDICWDPVGGKFLLSVSSDQTGRLHAPWLRKDNQVSWFEIARPQVHGYDIKCVAMVHRYKFVSGSDEKVVRVFDAPKNFIENFCRICSLDVQKELKVSTDIPEGASVPALGLSNRAVYQREVGLGVQPHPNEQYPEVYFSAVPLQEPPTEEHLLQNTLWPETQKLYGHGYEIFAVACDGEILASACKAAKAEFASIILWDLQTMRQLQSLAGPTLTVTQLAFSYSGRHLLAVSRDRTWTLYQRTDTQQSQSAPEFEKLACVDKKSSAHSRIIWSCCWSHDDYYFATGSRDKKVLMWECPTIPGVQMKPADMLETGESVTAVAMAPVMIKSERYLIAVGLENGSIVVYKWLPQVTWEQYLLLDKLTSHHLTVKRLCFRPMLGLAGEDNENEWLQLASCGADHGVRIYNIHLV